MSDGGYDDRKDDARRRAYAILAKKREELVSLSIELDTARKEAKLWEIKVANLQKKLDDLLK